jgi:hypothetical protein
MKQTHIGRASDQTRLESLSKKTLELLKTAASTEKTVLITSL